MPEKSNNAHAKAHSTPTKATHTPEAVYDSNPFTTAWTGAQKLLKTNLHNMVGLAFFNVFLFTVLGTTVIVVLLTLLAFVAKHNPQANIPMPRDTVYSFAASMSDSTIYLTWGIGALIIILVITLLQALQIRLTVAAARLTHIRFGALLKDSLEACLPLLGFGGLLVLCMVMLVLAIGLLAGLLGPITIVVALVAFVALVYVGFRLAFTTYGIVGERLSPIAAARQSWGITNGHIVETLGAAAITSLILAIPGVILSAFAKITENLPLLSGVLSVIDMVLTVLLVIVAAMAVAERYVQLLAISKGKLKATAVSPFNYLAIGLLLVVAPLLAALSPSQSNTSTTPLMPTNGNQPAPSEIQAPRNVY